MPIAKKPPADLLSTEITAWNARVTHPLQSWQWGVFRERMGIDVTRIHNWQLTFHKLPYLPFTVGYFPKGPAITSTMLATLTKLGKEKKAIYIQLEPDVEKHAFVPPSDAPLLVPSHHPLFTPHSFILDLTKTESELLAAMHPKTRYNLKVAQKHGVTVTQDSSPEAFHEYLRLSAETTSRQGFYAHNSAYHQTMWDTLSKAGIAKLFTARYQGEVLAAWVLFCWNKTVYYPYGASSRLHREVMAPTLLLWEIARWAKKEGYEAFDLWGALGEHPDSNDPWFGFHRFKQGFRPRHVTYAGSFDLVISPFLYRLYTVIDTVRWFFLKRSS